MGNLDKARSLFAELIVNGALFYSDPYDLFVVH